MVVDESDVCVRQKRPGEDDGVDDRSSSLTVSCEQAAFTELPGSLPAAAVTLDLSDNALESLGPLSRMRNVVNLRLRGNRINRIQHQPGSTSPGRQATWSMFSSSVISFQ